MRKAKKPTYAHSLISCGKIEKQILKYILKIGNERFNVSAFTRFYNLSNRQRFYDSIKPLLNKGFVHQPNGNGGGNYKLTPKGKAWLEGVGIHRTVCRKSPDVSYVRNHKFTFKIAIKSKPKNWGDGIGMLDSRGIQTKINAFSKNNKFILTKFPDDTANATFTNTHILIKPKNIFTNDTSDSVFQAISKTYEVIDFLIKLGFDFTNDKGILPLIQTEGHFAEVNSTLAQFFEKSAKGFSVKDSKGKNIFWIDHSNGHLEDETASEEHRENLKRQMRPLLENNDLPTLAEVSEDVNGLKEITSNLVKLQLMRTQNNITKNIEQLEKVNYIG